MYRYLKCCFVLLSVNFFWIVGVSYVLFFVYVDCLTLFLFIDVCDAVSTFLLNGKLLLGLLSLHNMEADC